MKKAVYETYSKLPKAVKEIPIDIVNQVRKYSVSRLKTPRQLTFFVTNRCNARCKHCFYWKELNKSKDLELREIRKITKSMGKVDSLLISGGEPFLRKDLYDIIVMFNRTNKTKDVTIPTNGSLTTDIEQTVRRILTNTKMRISLPISLEGLNEKHDSIRGVKGIFKKAVTTAMVMKRVNSKRLKCYFTITVNNKNYKEIPKFIEFSKKLGLPISFNYVRDSSRDVFGIDKSLANDFTPREDGYYIKDPEKLESINKLIDSNVKADDIPKRLNKLGRLVIVDVRKNKKRLLKCLAGKLDGVLYPNGEVAVCEFLRPIGNVKDFDYNFEKLWNSEKANNMRAKIKQCFCTHSCNINRSMMYDSRYIKKALDSCFS